MCAGTDTGSHQAATGHANKAKGNTHRGTADYVSSPACRPGFQALSRAAARHGHPGRAGHRSHPRWVSPMKICGTLVRPGDAGHFGAEGWCKSTRISSMAVTAFTQQAAGTDAIGTGGGEVDFDGLHAFSLCPRAGWPRARPSCRHPATGLVHSPVFGGGHGFARTDTAGAHQNDRQVLFSPQRAA